jgi:xanthosine utilization system XapX-like protein
MQHALAAPRTVADIGDSDLYTGREVKALLRQLLGASGSVVRWIDLDAAAAVLGMKPDTLRRNCARWSTMQNPPVQVRKKGPGACSHWLLNETDVYATRRQTTVALVPQDAAPDAPLQPSAEVALEAHWIDVVTRNL